jgi:hypothetical protein
MCINHAETEIKFLFLKKTKFSLLPLIYELQIKLPFQPWPPLANTPMILAKTERST